MSTYTALSHHKNELRAFLDVVWRTSPRIRSDAARFYAYEVASAASQGLVTTWNGRVYGVRWLITTAGLKKLSNASRKR
jgi:hypothetical protein